MDRHSDDASWPFYLVTLAVATIAVLSMLIYVTQPIWRR
jgi:hypothetical protein